MGGPSSGYLYEYRHNPEMTHEKYFALIEAKYPRSMGEANVHS